MLSMLLDEGGGQLATEITNKGAEVDARADGGQGMMY
jgi:hypothetical protein